MPFRRVVGLFAWLLTFELVLAGSDLICPEHGAHAARAQFVAGPEVPEALRTITSAAAALKGSSTRPGTSQVRWTAAR